MIMFVRVDYLLFCLTIGILVHVGPVCYSRDAV